jgi:hypothetical protein
LVKKVEVQERLLAPLLALLKLLSSYYADWLLSYD